MCPVSERRKGAYPVATNNPEYQKKYRALNAEKLNAYHREWIKANPEKRYKHKRKNYMKRKASGKIAAYREANKEAIAAYQREYQKTYQQLKKAKKEVSHD